MKKIMIITFIMLVVFLTSGLALARGHWHFGVFIAPPPIWIGPPAIIYREYHPPVYYYPPPPPYYYPSPPPYYSTPAKIRLDISSIPESCDVEIDGIYQGLTPITIELNQGVPVKVKISKAVYISWEKTILPKSDMRISPELEKKSN